MADHNSNEENSSDSSSLDELLIEQEAVVEETVEIPPASTNETDRINEAEDLAEVSDGETPDEQVPPTDKPEQIIQTYQGDEASTIWNIVGASVQGTSHIKTNLPCQDYHNYNILTERTIVGAVADGLGSASKSREGSKLAVDKAIEAISLVISQEYPTNEESWETAVKRGFHEARSKLVKQAEATNCPLREYGTTLIVIILNDEWLVTGQVGDGAVVALFEEGQLETVSYPQGGEYANQTIPLTTPDALEHAKFSAKKAEIQAVAILSDGIQHLSINSADHKPHAPFFTPIFGTLSTINDSQTISHQLAEYLASERVCARTDDDKTLLLIGRKRADLIEG